MSNSREYRSALCHHLTISMSLSSTWVPLVHRYLQTLKLIKIIKLIHDMLNVSNNVLGV